MLLILTPNITLNLILTPTLVSQSDVKQNLHMSENKKKNKEKKKYSMLFSMEQKKRKRPSYDSLSWDGVVECKMSTYLKMEKKLTY